MQFFKKKTPSYRANADWDVYYQDFYNGMPFGKQQEKLKAGGYAKGYAKVDPNYGRIDNRDMYDKDVKERGKDYSERLRKLGIYMKR